MSSNSEGYRVNISPESPKASQQPRRQWFCFISILLLLATILGVSQYRSYQRELKQEGYKISTQTGVIARNMERQIAVSDAALQEVIRDINFLRQSEQKERARKRLQVLCTALAGVRTLFITNADGTIEISNRPELEGNNFSHRDYFQTPKKAARSNLLYISSPFQSVLGTYVINLSRIITKPDGSFDGIVSAAINPDYFKVLLQSVLYAQDMTISINHYDGIRFMSMPQLPGGAGQDISIPGSPFSLHKQTTAPESSFDISVPPTGEYHLVAAATLQTTRLQMDKPPIIITSRKRSAVLEDWGQKLYLQVSTLCAIALAAGISLHRFQTKSIEKAQAERELAELRQKFVDIFEFLPDATMVVDNMKKVVAWNQTMEALSGISKHEILGQNSSAYAPAFYGEQRQTLLIDLLDLPDDELEAHYRNIQRNGNNLTAEAYCPALHNGSGAYVWAIVAPLFDVEGNKIGAIESIRDISLAKQLETELKEANRRLEELARIDELTGIYNRRMFRELLQAELARSCRYDTPVSLIMFDIDRFKQINDTRGHNLGDHVLKEITRIITARLRVHDIFGRWGGEEFTILVPKSDLHQAVVLAENLRSLIEEHDFGNDLKVTASFGVTLHICEESTESLIERADTALYRAKNGGRNRVESQ